MSEATQLPVEQRWWHRRYAAFDVESTGVDVYSDRIVTAAIVCVSGGSPPARYSWLINPGVEIPAAASAIHGVTTELAREKGRDPKEALADILEALRQVWASGAPVVAYNASFDLTILRAEAERHGLKFPPAVAAGQSIAAVVDPFVIDKALDPFRKGKRTLAATCAHHRAVLDSAHEATSDALAAARLAWALCERDERAGKRTLAELHQAQIRWHAEQAASLELYLRRSKPDAVVERGWPVRAGRAA